MNDTTRLDRREFLREAAMAAAGIAAGGGVLLKPAEQALAREQAVSKQAFELARDGQPACSIVTAERPTPAARLAALETAMPRAQDHWRHASDPYRDSGIPRRPDSRR